jgi:hypothetical protein
MGGPIQDQIPMLSADIFTFQVADNLVGIVIWSDRITLTKPKPISVAIMG